MRLDSRLRKATSVDLLLDDIVLYLGLGDDLQLAFIL